MAEQAAAPTAYVVLSNADGGWTVITGSFEGINGEAAIKQATRKGADEHHAGIYKAVPLRTWNSDSNNLEIETETKTVSTFKKPSDKLGERIADRVTSFVGETADVTPAA